MTTLPFELKERDITRQVCDFLRVHRWRLIRMNVSKVQFNDAGWTQFGETGMPDYLALYYLPDSLAVAMWLEFKQRKGKLARHQELWHARERKDGASVYTVRDYESFRTFYAATFDRPDSPVKGQRELMVSSKSV